MSEQQIPLEEWLESLREAAREVTALSLRFDAAEAAPRPPGEGAPGAYIAILGRATSVHLGIATSPAGMQVLARALLGVRGGQSLDPRDAADGMSEILNILAGKVKSRMGAEDGALLLGLPMFVPAVIPPQADLESVTADIRIGPVPCRVFVHRRARVDARAA